jgi:hypothetical protein
MHLVKYSFVSNKQLSLTISYSSFICAMCTAHGWIPLRIYIVYLITYGEGVPIPGIYTECFLAETQGAEGRDNLEDFQIFWLFMGFLIMTVD